jgi:hypothetical protein
VIGVIKKACGYFAATLGLVFSVKEGFAIQAGWSSLTLATMGIGVLCVAAVWVEAYVIPRITGVSEASPLHSDGSLSLAVKRALDLARFAPRDDEALAEQANLLVRRTLDKRCISYGDYRDWRVKNPYIFTAIVDGENTLIGFFDVFPLTDDAAAELVSGKRAEREIKMSDILSASDNARAKALYVASVFANPQHPHLRSLVAKDVLLLKFIEFLIDTFPPTPDRHLLAFAHTREGDRLLRNAGFANVLLPINSRQRDPLYKLAASEYAQLCWLAEPFRGNPKAQRRLRRRVRSIKQHLFCKSRFSEVGHLASMVR